MYNLGTENVGSSYGAQRRITQDFQPSTIGATPQTLNTGNCRVAGIHNPTGAPITVTLKDGATTVLSLTIAAGDSQRIPPCRFATSLVASAGTGAVVFWSPGAFTFVSAHNADVVVTTPPPGGGGMAANARLLGDGTTERVLSDGSTERITA